MVRFWFLRYGKQEQPDRTLLKVFQTALPGAAGTSLLTVVFDE